MQTRFWMLFLAALGPSCLRADAAPERPLRYRPDGTDFVIRNGTERYNRPLYGGNTAFRVDAGDRPEFVLYLPGRGGNIRLGVTIGDQAWWLHEAASIEARYRPGSMRYEVRDPRLGNGVIQIDAVASYTREGLLLRVEAAACPPGADLWWAYGGANGQRGRRDGDIGTENVPISQWFQLRPEFCEDSRFEVAANGFLLTCPPGRIRGQGPQGAAYTITNAADWDDLSALREAESSDPPRPIVVGRCPLGEAPLHLAWWRLGANDDPGSPADPAAAFAAAERTRADRAGQVAVETPDPYLNAAVAALAIGADAAWDEPQGAVMHGAIAWRRRLLGWRGPYAMDALGWHDRARRHLTYWAGRQNQDPVPDRLPPPDEDANLARSERALHSNGALSESHYDMNLVYIDALFRHLMWTGDLAFAREVWPVILRHLAWERRLFRRQFGDPPLPLYEAYAAIWASDELGYNGGGVTHASAYNLYHLRWTARLARLLGEDPDPFDQEASLLEQGLRQHLWLPDRGWYAEYKDLLGLQRPHPAAGLWTVYHAVDSGIATPREAWQLTRYVDSRIPSAPVRGPGVPADRTYRVLATSDWMPYHWSVNNVVMGEILHTALAYWQTGRPETAYNLAKGAILASMYMGICPGNVGSMNFFDAYRGESQRDFADGSGVFARALVEGLFGVRPDLMEGVLDIAPGLPEAWDHARLDHPSVTFEFHRPTDARDHYRITSRLPQPVRLRLRTPARTVEIASVRIDGRDAPWTPAADAVGRPAIVVETAIDPGHGAFVEVQWAGDPPADAPDATAAAGRPVLFEIPAARVQEVADPQGMLADAVQTPHSIQGTAAGHPGHRTAFARVTQGDLHWWMPLALHILPEDAETHDPFDWSRPHPHTSRLEPVDLTTLFNDRVTQIFRNEYRSPRSPYVSLAIPKQGIGGWAGAMNMTADIDDQGLRLAAATHGGRFLLPNGVPLATPGDADTPNVLFVSHWDNYPEQSTIPLDGHASRAYLLMAGSTYWMQSRFDNAEVVVSYADGPPSRLALHNPTTWWPIDRDYYIDDFQFARREPIPPRVDLATGQVRLLTPDDCNRLNASVPGGAANLLTLPLDPERELSALTLRALANEVVIGLMAVTLERP